MMNMAAEAFGISVTFDSATTELDALQRAAYVMAALATADIRASGNEYVCTLYPQDPSTDSDALVHRIRSEVIDQTLRIRIARETEPLRNLIFALAFSQTGVVDGETPPS
jgi:His-Xaa-Ser system protein HxsD